MKLENLIPSLGILGSLFLVSKENRSKTISFYMCLRFEI